MTDALDESQLPERAPITTPMSRLAVLSLFSGGATFLLSFLYAALPSGELLPLPLVSAIISTVSGALASILLLVRLGRLRGLVPAGAGPALSFISVALLVPSG